MSMEMRKPSERELEPLDGTRVNVTVPTVKVYPPQHVAALEAQLAQAEQERDEARADAGELTAIMALVSDRSEVGTYAKVEALEAERDAERAERLRNNEAVAESIRHLEAQLAEAIRAKEQAEALTKEIRDQQKEDYDRADIWQRTAEELRADNRELIHERARVAADRDALRRDRDALQHDKADLEARLESREEAWIDSLRQVRASHVAKPAVPVEQLQQLAEKLRAWTLNDEAATIELVCDTLDALDALIAAALTPDPKAQV